MRRTLTAVLPALALVVAAARRPACVRRLPGGDRDPAVGSSGRLRSRPSTSPGACSTAARLRATRRRRWPCATCGRRCPHCPPRPGARAEAMLARPDRRPGRPLRLRLHRAVGQEVRQGRLRPLGQEHRRRAAQQGVGQADAQGDAAGLQADDRAATATASPSRTATGAGTRSSTSTSRTSARSASTATARPRRGSSASSPPATACSTTTSRARSSPPLRARASRSPPPTSSSTPCSTPTTPRTTAG